MEFVYRSILLIGIALFSASLMAAQATNLSVNNDNSINVFTNDKTNIVIAATQPVFILKLKSNPTTGYSWFLREYDASLISPLKHSFQAPDKKLIGASGFELWTFKLKPQAFVVPHQTMVRMVYMRPWQGTDNSTQVIFRVTTQESEKTS